MNKHILVIPILTLTFVVGFTFGDLTTALGLESSFPPTPAFSTISIDNNQIIEPNTLTNVTAKNHTDTLYLVSDGSILINITGFTP